MLENDIVSGSVGNLKFHNCPRDLQGSASGTGSPGSRSPGPENLGTGLRLIQKSGTGTGTQIQHLRDLGLGPALRMRDEGFRDSTFGDCLGN